MLTCTHSNDSTHYSRYWFFRNVGNVVTHPAAVAELTFFVAKFVVFLATMAAAVGAGCLNAASKVNATALDAEGEPLLGSINDTAETTVKAGGGSGHGHGHEGGGHGHGHGGGGSGAGTVKQRTGSTFAGLNRKLAVMWPCIWPSGKPGLQLRVALCVGCLVGTRIVNLYVPIYYKRVVDTLGGNGNTGDITFPVNEILLYVFMRFLQGGGIGSMGK